MTRNNNKYILMVLVTSALLTPVAGRAADAAMDTVAKGGLGVGFGIVRFDTNAKFTNKETGNSIFIDAEGSLGLPDEDSVPFVFGLYRFSPNHSLSFSYFQVRRDATLLDFDETVGDITIAGDATLTDRTRFYNLGYSYTFFEDDRSRVLGLIGINGLDLRYGFEANGQITEDGVTRTGTLEEEANIFAPLPLFGLDFFFSFTPKWGMATKVAMVFGRYQDVSAAVLQTTVRARYQFNRRIGTVFGITYFDADIKVEDDQERIDINYGYDGASLGLYIAF